MILCTAALAMAACTNELTETVGTSTQPSVTLEGGFAWAETKTAFTDAEAPTNKLVWSKDDAIGIFSMNPENANGEEKNAYIAKELMKKFPFKMVASVWRAETSITTFKLQSMIYTEGKAYYSKEYGVILLYPEIFSEVEKQDGGVFFTDPVTEATISFWADSIILSTFACSQLFRRFVIFL